MSRGLTLAAVLADLVASHDVHFNDDQLLIRYRRTGEVSIYKPSRYPSLEAVVRAAWAGEAPRSASDAA